MSASEQSLSVKTESRKRTASDCGFINNDDCPPSKKAKVETNNNNNSGTNDQKKSKRKVALILSYLGTKYHGSAMSGNQVVPTVSSTVFDTLCKIGAISKNNASNPKKVSFAASSRTDKGVHAAAATFALKMVNLFEDPDQEAILNPAQTKKKKKEDKDDTEDIDIDTDEHTRARLQQKCEYAQWNEMKDLINASLPDDIQIHGIQRTTKNFDPRFKAWSRVYRYLIPTYLFDVSIKARDIADIEDRFCEYIIQKEKARRAKKQDGIKEEEHVQDDDIKKGIKSECKERDNDIRFSYRISDGLLERLKALCQIYVGTRNYHNFTRRTHPTEDRAKRLIHSIEIIDSSLIMDGMEYLQFEIHGASFLYHQIRKMVGFLVVLMRDSQYVFKRMQDGIDVSEDNDDVDVKEIQRMMFSEDYKMTVPLAPSQGLYLKSVRFTEYNKKCIKDKQPWKQLKLERYNEGVDAFVTSKILPSITRYEVNDNALEGNKFAFWLYDLDNDFKFEIVKITKELSRKLKEKGIEYINADSHEPIDKFYEKIINRSNTRKRN